MEPGISEIIVVVCSCKSLDSCKEAAPIGRSNRVAPGALHFEGLRDRA